MSFIDEIDVYRLEDILYYFDIEKIKCFLDSKPNINEIKLSYDYPLMHFIVMTCNTDLVKLYLDYSKSYPDKADIQILDDYGCNLLIQAALVINPEPMIRLLLSYGVNPLNKSNSQETPLHLLCQANEIEASKLLLEHGADPNAILPEDLNENLENITPAHFAALHDNLDMIKLLVCYGADINIKCRFVFDGEVMYTANVKDMYVKGIEAKQLQFDQIIGIIHETTDAIAGEAGASVDTVNER